MNAPIKPQTLVPFVALSLLVAGGETLAQSIIPASDGTGTIVNLDGNEFVIEGGTLSGDGANLFHSFIELGLDANQIATFLAHPQIQNILGRVTGGNPSIIDGLIQVLGGDSNLYLMNPSGFVFGSNASLNVPGDFFVTTAQGIGFGNGLWFDAWGDNDYQSLVGTPVEFDLSDRSGTIINAGNLAVSEGQNIGLIGGSVINTGSLNAPEGNVSIVAMPESGRLRIVSGDNILGFEIEPPRDEQGNPEAIRAVDIPELITGSGVETGLTVEGNAVRIDNSELLVETGDVVSRNIIADNAILSAANNLTLPESQIATTNHLTLLAGDTVRIRDSENQPFLARAGGDFYIQGDRNIDILALNHLVTPLVSEGNLTLVSDGNISGDAHFSSGGNFSMLNLSGDAGNFVSLYDPIIRANGDIEFGNYTGVALKVEATGSIQGGDIRITGADISGSIPLSDPDYTILTTSQSVILRAGLASVTSTNFPGTTGGTNFNSPGTPLLPSGSIQVGNVYPCFVTLGRV
ncbi:MAG: filamentous hemagglutinin N-terminal domain-containing protein [Cyanobacteria bacterium SBLK]|nr:filamentous hemagglutinin N-terminal domain-containing protein [Cyanobacteria bacterium SBLK]